MAPSTAAGAGANAICATRGVVGSEADDDWAYCINSCLSVSLLVVVLLVNMKYTRHVLIM